MIEQTGIPRSPSLADPYARRAAQLESMKACRAEAVAEVEHWQAIVDRCDSLAERIVRAYAREQERTEPVSVPETLPVAPPAAQNGSAVAGAGSEVPAPQNGSQRVMNPDRRYLVDLARGGNWRFDAPWRA